MGIVISIIFVHVFILFKVLFFHKSKGGCSQYLRSYKGKSGISSCFIGLSTAGLTRFRNGIGAGFAKSLPASCSDNWRNPHILLQKLRTKPEGL